MYLARFGFKCSTVAAVVRMFTTLYDAELTASPQVVLVIVINALRQMLPGFAPVPSNWNTIGCTVPLPPTFYKLSWCVVSGAWLLHILRQAEGNVTTGFPC